MTTAKFPKCPSCETVLSKVFIISSCMQVANLNAQGVVTSYGSPIVGDLLYAECPKCGQSTGLDVDNDKVKINGVYFGKHEQQAVAA